MAYSLTDATALGLDLARTPGGVEAAGVLLRGLLPVGDAPAPPSAPAGLANARTRALALVGPSAPTVVDLDATAGLTGAPDPDGGAGSGLDAAADALALRLRRILRRLGTVSFGTVSELMTLALDLPLDPPLVRPAGGLRIASALQRDRGEVLADAVLAALVRHRDDPAAPVLARALTRRLDGTGPATAPLPALPAPGRVPVAVDPGPAGTVASDLLARLAAVDPVLLLRAAGPAPHVWAEHMHSAAWAVETTGRTRLAAAAQLDLLRCLAAAGVDEAVLLSGVWNRCSAAVQATVVADVVGEDTLVVLRADLLDVLPG